MIDYDKWADTATTIAFRRLSCNTFKFQRIGEESKDTDIVVEGDVVGLVDTSLSPIDEDIRNSFDMFKQSPIYQVGLKVDIQSKTLHELIDYYETLIAGICLARCGNQFGGNNVAVKRIDAILKWLRNSDFYTAPASTVYHGSFVGGLLIHSLEVYNQIMSLMQLNQFQNIDIISAAIVALMHDWCKIGLYETYDKNVKNSETGQWEQVKAFKRNQTGIPLGHGTSSMFLAMRFFPNLSPEEACAIRWHQGHWNCCEPEEDEFQRANEIYPLVHMLQFADQLAITQYANQKI